MNKHVFTPALTRAPLPLTPLKCAYELLQRASDAGFKWPNAQLVLDKMKEEQRETEEATASGERKKIAEEVGDLLMATVNLARFTGVEMNALSLAPSDAKNPEQALQEMQTAMESIQTSLTAGESVEAPVRGLMAATSALANLKGINSGQCLVDTNEKFATRFNAVEKILYQQGRTMATTPLKEMIGLWNQQKDVPAWVRA